MRCPELLIAVGLTLACTVAAHAESKSEPTFWTTVGKDRRGGAPPAVADLVARAEQAVVHVRGTTLVPNRGGAQITPTPTPTPGTNMGGRKMRVEVGSGFIIHRDGYIVTNEHVVRDAQELRVRLFAGRELPACVVGADTQTDVALLKVESESPLPVLPLGDSESVRVGDPVLAIGSPFGFDSSVTQGIVSAKGRVVDRSTLPEARGPDIYSFFIQTDASINVGNSGGPLVDMNGAAIGISAAFWAGHPLQPAQGIGFAIPINMAKSLLPSLRVEGSTQRSFLGVDAQPLDAALAVAFSRPSTRGALIASVAPGSPAEAAGLEAGDIVATVNNRPITTSEDLKIEIQLTPPGSRIRLSLLRGGERLEREITTALASDGQRATPLPASCRSIRPNAGPRGDGFEVTETPAPQAARLPGGRGVSVSRVQPLGAAAEAGLQVGDVILRAGKASVRTREDLSKAISQIRRGDTVALLVRRAGYDFWTALTRR